MNKFSIFFFALFTITFFSCSNDDDVSNPPEEEANYFALKVGNSWKYNVYRFNGTTSEYEEQDIVITNTITGTEIINDETYFIFETTSVGNDECQLCLDELGNKSVRDSLGYLVDNTGVKRFTTQSEAPYLLIQQDFGKIFGQYQSTITTAQTPAGSFSDVDTNTYFLEFNDGSISEGEDSSFYREKEGLIAKTISFVTSPDPLYILTLLESNISD
ncbi:hypothetical protein [Marinirhabdus gelatinilytica]|uniref:Lipocalin-like protein n=1 Tax=Marinirhabdus gelatinilytica TaxID=1703343 RepID=A0A370Q7C0_9FLAO|nr:hypothetical protein [Marinirhabdus gelatinilytica]RDK84253.1 hypothetical protein C8D94_10598 [Marinirhabdus gelatinilytica]